MPRTRPVLHALAATSVVLAAVVAALVTVPGSQAGAPTQPRSLFSAAEPTGLRVRDAGRPMTVGTRFQVRRTGLVVGLRFWKDESARGIHVGALWNGNGKRLARVVFDQESSRGWQQATLSTPVEVRADRTYLVSTRSSDGRYVVAPGYRHTSHSAALAFAGTRSAVVHTNTPGRSSSRPGAVFVDVLFNPTSTGATPSPAPTSDATSIPTPASTAGPTASSTPTSTPSPARSATCKPVPSSCGYPDSTNTGPSPGTVFTRVPGQATSGPGWTWNSTYHTVFVSGSGAVLDSLDIAGAVVIDAPNVVVRNSRIAACGGSDDGDVVAVRYQSGDPSYRGSNATIQDNEIIGTPAGCTHRARSGVRDVYGQAPNVLVRGNDISGTGNGVTIEYQGLVVDNWVHDLGHMAADHHSGLSSHGGALQVTYRHNTVLLAGASYPGGGGLSGAVTVYSDFGHAQNVTIEGNFISGGSYVVYGGNSGDDYTTPATSIKIRDNRYACPEWIWGYLGMFSATSAGNEFTGNYCDATGASLS